MTTLNDIINSIDEQIILAEQAGSAMSSSRPMFGLQEKMQKYVLVLVQTEKISIPIEGLAEIGPMPMITPLPNLPLWIHGIINQRGEIISVIDLDVLLHGGEVSEAIGKKLAILRHGSIKVGICIDQVIATVSKPESDQMYTPEAYLSQAAPDVFGKTLHVDAVAYQILQPGAFFSMDRLMQYYISD